MHTLFIPSWYPTTEAPLNGIYFAEQAQCLSQHGMRVGVIFPEQQSLRRASLEALQRKHFQIEWTNDHGIPTLRRYGWNVWWGFPPGFRLRVRSAARLARRYMNRYGVPDVIHAQSGRWAGAAAARIRESTSVPYVLTEHFSGFQRDAIFPWRWPLIEEGYRHASAIAAVSTSLRRTLATHDLASADEVHIHPNLAPTSFFTLPPTERLSPPPFHLVTVARLNAQKNVGGLLDAFAQTVQEGNEGSLFVVGSGPKENELKQKTRHLNIDAQVYFLGRLDRQSVRNVLWNAHAFVLPSHQETFGVVLLEAMATGLPVVTTACGGPEDLVHPDVGLLVPPNDTEALADALREIQERWTSFDAQNIRARTVDQYGPEAFVRRTKSFYSRALAVTS